MFISIYDTNSQNGLPSRVVHWLQMDHWTLHEAAMLFCNIAPDFAVISGTGRLKACMSLSLEYFGEDEELYMRALRFRPEENEDDIESEEEEESMPVDQVADLLDDMVARLKSSQSAGLVRESMPPAEWIEYAEKKRIGIPWMAWARHRKHWPRTPGAPKAQSAAPTTTSAMTRGNKTLLRLVAVMAKAGYGYDPAALKSPVPKQIADDAERHGHPVDVDTVLKWLRQANEEFPPAEPKPKPKPKSV